MAAPARKSSIRQDALNLPNLLTMLRVVMIPIVLVLMYHGTRAAAVWAALVYSLAAVTDALDGWLARRQGLISVLGKFLDPLADKLLVLATLVMMVELGHIPAWPVIVIASRELSVTALRTIAATEGVVMAASQGGKDKTALQMVAVLTLILHHTYTLNFVFADLTVSMTAVGLALLYVSVFFTLTSAGEYIKLFVDAVEAKERRLS